MSAPEHRYTPDNGKALSYVCWRRNDEEGDCDRYFDTYKEGDEFAQQLHEQGMKYIWTMQWGEFQLPWWADTKWRKGWVFRWWSEAVTAQREYPADVCGAPPGADAGVPDTMKTECVFRPAPR
jgi:hypothetical protein